MSKKLLSWMLTICMLLTMMPTMAWAEETKTLNLSNGAVTVVDGTAAETVTYKQGGTAVYTDVPVSEEVIITGSFTVETTPAITITKCSPTIVMKDLQITATAKNAQSNILIDGEATDDVKFILSGTNNKLIRGSNGSSSAQIRMYCAIQIKNATLTFDCQCENGECKDASCTDKLTVDAGNGYGAVIGAKSAENVGFALNFNGGYVSVDVDYGSNRDGAIIGAPFHSSVQFTNTIAINVNDGYLSVIADESAPALGAARARCDLSKISVAINGGVVKTATVETNRNPMASIYAGSLEITNGADVAVQGNIQANTVAVTDAKLVLEEKVQTNTENPGGSIISNNVTVTSTDGEASLTTAGGIKGNLTTSGDTEVTILGTAATSTSAAPSADVGGVSGTVNVGEGSSVAVTEDIKGDVIVEGGATINEVTLPANMEGTITVSGNTVDEIVVADDAVTLPAGSVVTKEDDSKVEMSGGGTLEANGDIVAGGTVTTKDAEGNTVATVVVPEGETATVGTNGEVAVPAGTVVENADGTTTTLTSSGSVNATSGSIASQGASVTLKLNSAVSSVVAPEGGWKEGDNTFTVSNELACYVAVSYDSGATYKKLAATEVDGAYSFTAEDITGATMIAVGIAGDLNGNGRLDVLDARQVITAVHGNPDALKMLALDVNGNDRADALDARQIFSAVLGEGLTW